MELISGTHYSKFPTAACYKLNELLHCQMLYMTAYMYEYPVGLQHEYRVAGISSSAAVGQPRQLVAGYHLLPLSFCGTT